MSRMIVCSKSQYHGAYAEGGCCQWCEPPTKKPSWADASGERILRDIQVSFGGAPAVPMHVTSLKLPPATPPKPLIPGGFKHSTLNPAGKLVEFDTNKVVWADKTGGHYRALTSAQYDSLYNIRWAHRRMMPKTVLYGVAYSEIVPFLNALGWVGTKATNTHNGVCDLEVML